MLKELSDQIFKQLNEALDEIRPTLETNEVACVLKVGNGVAMVSGFTNVRANELVRLPNGLVGLASNISEKQVGLILLGDAKTLHVGDPAHRMKRVIDIPVGEGLLNRVVDALGRPLDGEGQLKTYERRKIEQPAPPISHRAPVEVPLQTGIKAIDAAIPIGCGQRELIIGDRQSGKTTIAVDTILNQSESGVISIYCAIGQRASAVARVIHTLREGGAMDRSIIMFASGEDAPGLQYIAPYAATTIAEYFMQLGKDVLIVYDDLTRHARAYRELSLLLRRPPGREAYPGDIFYIHSRLLERSTRLQKKYGGGSLTALPIIETQAQNISAYIPTNLISITDGQIYLSPSLFEKGQLPAIDIAKSVSRVGARAQLPAYRAIAGDLRLSYSQFEELETFARFGTRLDEETRLKLDRGRRVREVLKQKEHEHLSVAEQFVVLLATLEGLLDTVPLEDIADAERVVQNYMSQRFGELCAKIDQGGTIGKEDRETLIAALREKLREENLIENERS